MFGKGYFLRLVGGTVGVINHGLKYNKLVRVSDGKEISIFLNPSIYGGVSTEVMPVWDGTTLSFVPVSPSELDDRYTVGNSSRLVFGGSNAYPKFDANVDLSQYSLTVVPETASIAPILFFKVTDYRLASHDTFAVVFHDFWTKLQDDLDNVTPVFSPNDFLDIFNTPKNFLFKFSSLLFNPTCSNYALSLEDDGTVHVVMSDIEYKHDGVPLTNDELLFGRSDPIGKGSAYHTVMSKLFCNYGFVPYTDVLEKPLNGLLTIIARPERFISFNQMASNAIQSIANLIADTTAKASFIDLANKTLQEGLKDWFRPSSYRVLVGYDRNNNPIYQNVNVFLTFQGSHYRDGLLMVDMNGVSIGVPVSFGDTFDYSVNESGKAYPESKSYITGPYGTIPVFDSAGNIIDWVSDAYAK